MGYKVIFIRSASGRKYVLDFLATLNKNTYSHAEHLLDQLRCYGPYIAHTKYAKLVEPDIYELRVLGKIQVRIFYTVRQKNIILLHGFIKKSRAIPRKEIKLPAVD